MFKVMMECEYPCKSKVAGDGMEPQMQGEELRVIF